MSVIRGSQHKLVGIAEVTFGVTPATPVMLELPITNFNPTSNSGTMESAQLRAHPFVDQLLSTVFSHSIGLDWEMQANNQDSLIQMLCGDTWTTNVVKVKDVLSSMTIESQNNGTLFSQYTGFFIGKTSVSVGSGDNAPIKITATGMAKAATLDAGATIASSVTAAAANTPMVFTGASATISGSAVALTNISFDLERTVNPLQLIGATTPREYVPAQVKLSGSLTVPYDAGAQSTVFAGFTDAPLVLTCAQGAKSFAFSIPKTKFTSFGRQVNQRGAILQSINWEAYYDTSSSTVMSITRVP